MLIWLRNDRVTKRAAPRGKENVTHFRPFYGSRSTWQTRYKFTTSVDLSVLF